MSEGESGSGEDAGVGSELQYFFEKDQCMSLLVELCSLQRQEEFRSKYDEYNKILLKYLEQPLLLNPHIVDLVSPLSSAISLVTTESKVEDTAVQHFICKATYSLCRVVGYKYVLKHFPHEVNHLEECLALLKKQNKLDHDNWETAYVLLHWLAALCLIPFDICSMDSSADISVMGRSNLVTNIVQTCKSFMHDTGPTREAASICLSVLLTRPDMEDVHLQEFMTWATSLLDSLLQVQVVERSNLSPQYFLMLGVLRCLFQIYKLGHRLKLLPYGPILLPLCLQLAEGHVPTSARKLLTKLVQRIGMNFLPPRLAAWRYMRGNRSLNLVGKKKCTVSLSGSSVSTDAVEETEDADDEVPDDMEDIIDRLLISLQDKDTVVRWSAAKGLGRITMRLAQDLAGDVIDAVVDVFADAEADSNWHGGCLALAELSRRGLLLPDRLAVVMPYIERAIRFDVMRGQHSIGAHVRDAACYVCWAFSRAYSPAVMAPYIRTLTNALLRTALFDREVNCRRAASAAYQETVGRQGDQNVPNGITIITIADYFSVGNRLNCFTCIAASVAALDREVNQSLMMHLATTTARHWDREMRELAALALASLAPLNVGAAAEHLERLVETTTAVNLNLRHGSILATAELLFALAVEGAVLSDTLVASIVGIVASIEKGRLFRGTGGALIREAVCGLVRNIAKARILLSVKVQVAYVDSLNEHLRQPHDSVQFAARDSLREFMHSYFAAGDIPSERLQKLTVQKYLDGLLTDTNVSVTRGCALALGVMPARLLLLPVGRFDQVLDCLEKCGSASYRIGGEYDANTCCYCISSLDEIAERLSASILFTADHIQRCFSIFFQATKDYSVDKRGDTGSWSRIAAMRGMERLFYACLRFERNPQFRFNSGLQRVFEGSIIDTSFGVGLVKKILTRTAKQIVLEISYPPSSLGEFEFGKAIPKCIVNEETQGCFDSADLVGRSSDGTISLLRETSLQLLRTILKQLAEKLDSVREVAGAALVRLLMAYSDDCSLRGDNDQLFHFPDYEKIMRATAQTQEGGLATINWADPSKVYPIVCYILQSSHYFVPILSGLVLSVGGLSETTAKCSAKALLSFCERASAEGDTGRLEGLATALVTLLVNNKKCDRVIVPTLKSTLMILNEGVFDELHNDFLAQFTSDMFDILAFEARGATNVTKLCVILDLLVRLLSLHQGSTRLSGLQTALAMLTHKYPRVRKHCAELLYICFLSDNCCVGIDAIVDECGVRLHPFFKSQPALDRALQVLSSSSWDASEKTALFNARIELTELIGLSEVAIAVRLVSQEERSVPVGKEGPDELDSYEALVRDAGNWIENVFNYTYKPISPFVFLFHFYYAYLSGY